MIPTEIYVEGGIEDDADEEILRRLGLEATSLKWGLEIIRDANIANKEEAEDTSVIKTFVRLWLSTLPQTLLSEINIAVPDLLINCPKRWSVYQPMVLLPAGSFQNPAWIALLLQLEQIHQTSLWSGVIAAVSSKESDTPLTHLAINSGIPLIASSLTSSSTTSKNENILRSPSGLIMVHGNWGPDLPAGQDSPSEDDFQSAFWVHTKQNGIFQTWAPRYTMFSRGNVKEKARILSFHEATKGKTSKRRQASRQLGNTVAVDMYAGIGYFTFSYAAMGVGMVLCWEINPWSVEGLRRGLEMNGWSYRVIRGDDLKGPLQMQFGQEAKIVVFEENNECAAARIEQLRKEDDSALLGKAVVHVNCGFLPSSEPSWRSAWKILSKERDSWLHLHENIGVNDVEARREKIESEVRMWATTEVTACAVEVDHVEYVKTFAPGVWHVVFDVHISPHTVAGVDD